MTVFRQDFMVSNCNMKEVDSLKRLTILILLLFMLISYGGCGLKVNVVEDDYSLDKIEGDITCEYRIGEEARWSKEMGDYWQPIIESVEACLH